MTQSEFNYLEFYIKIENENDIINGINLVGIHPFCTVGVNLKLIPLEQGLFKGFNEKNSIIYINDEKLESFSLIHKFPEIGTYKIKIEVKKQMDVYKAKMEALLISQLELLKDINKEE